MFKYELQNAADCLVKDMFQVKRGETVVITADTCSYEDVVDAVASSATAAGAKLLVINMPTPGGVGKAADPDLPVEALSAVLTAADVWMEFNHQWLLYSTPFENAMRDNEKLRYMCLVDIDAAVFTRIIGSVDLKQLKKFMIAAREKHLGAKVMRVTTPAGTDVSFEIDPDHLMQLDYGDASAPGMWMAPGQFNIVPRFGTVNGKIVFDGTVTPPFGKKLSENISLTVEKGVIQKIEGGSEAAQYEEWLKSFDDPGMFKMAHIAYGFNPGAILTGNVVEDERVWGCTEWGIGYVSPVDAPPAGQDAASHTDGICLNTSVWLDGKQFLKEGHVVDPELKAISPIK